MVHMMVFVWIFEKLKEVFVDDSSNICTIIVLVHLRFVSYVLEHC